MSEGTSAWKKPLKAVDGALRKLSKKLQKIIKILRLVRFALLLVALAPLVLAGLTFWKPLVFLPYTAAVLAVYTVVPIIALWFLAGLPLKAKSVIRLVDKGYPGNAKELGLRVAARKLHEQSIETEELLLDTAINESKKALKKYQGRAEELARQLDDMPDDAAPEPSTDDGEAAADSPPVDDADGTR